MNIFEARREVINRLFWTSAITSFVFGVLMGVAVRSGHPLLALIAAAGWGVGFGVCAAIFFLPGVWKK